MGDAARQLRSSDARNGQIWARFANGPFGPMVDAYPPSGREGVLEPVVECELSAETMSSGYPRRSSRSHDQTERRRLPRRVAVAGRAPSPADNWNRKTQKPWRRPIFPKGCPLSIFGAGELNFRVRDGNGCGLSASVTRISCVWTCFGSDLGRMQPRDGVFEELDFVCCVAARRKDARISPIQPLTPGQLLKRSSPRPLVRLSFICHQTSTCRLSNRWSPCGLTRLTRWGTSS